MNEWPPETLETTLEAAKEDTEMLPTIEAALKDITTIAADISEDLSDPREVCQLDVEDIHGYADALRKAADRFEQYAHYAPFYYDVIERM